jgi:hypothetical protein
VSDSQKLTGFLRVKPAVREELEKLAAELRQRPGCGRMTPGDVVELLLAERKETTRSQTAPVFREARPR